MIWWHITAAVCGKATLVLAAMLLAMGSQRSGDRGSNVYAWLQFIAGLIIATFIACAWEGDAFLRAHHG